MGCVSEQTFCRWGHGKQEQYHDCGDTPPEQVDGASTSGILALLDAIQQHLRFLELPRSNPDLYSAERNSVMPEDRGELARQRNGLNSICPQERRCHCRLSEPVASGNSNKPVIRFFHRTPCLNPLFIVKDQNLSRNANHDSARKSNGARSDVPPGKAGTFSRAKGASMSFLPSTRSA